MLDAIYDAVFEDARGRETTRIRNDGQELRMSLRGVEFVGSDFDSLSPESVDLERARLLFSLHRAELCSCRLDWTMPLELDCRGESQSGALSVSLVLGDPLPNGSIRAEALKLELETPLATICSSARSGCPEQASGGSGGRRVPRIRAVATDLPVDLK